MSIYTQTSLQDVNAWITHYPSLKTPFTEITPLFGGTVNSNYRLINQHGEKLVLTFFETLQTSHIEKILSFTKYLHDHQTPCPMPIVSKAHCFTTMLHNKPAALVSFLSGTAPKDITKNKIQQIGTWLAKMHLLSEKYKHQITNSMGDSWLINTRARISSALVADEQQLLNNAFASIASLNELVLPQGIIHADLFPDNTLFNEKTLEGVIDFYFSCTEPFVYDLAITAIAWCTTSSGIIQTSLYDTLVKNYQQNRPLSPTEQNYLQQFLIKAALRFWLSRIESKLFPRPGQDILIKDPNFIKAVLKNLL